MWKRKSSEVEEKQPLTTKRVRKPPKRFENEIFEEENSKKSKGKILPY